MSAYTDGPPGLEADANAAKTMSEEERVWQTVLREPTNFTLWTQLLALADRSTSDAFLRRSFDAFLDEFPLCYGYWKKYADGVRRNTGDFEAVFDIYSRAVRAIACSVEMWTYYVDFAVEAKKDRSVIRSILESAVDACGSVPQAGPLWDRLLEIEASGDDGQNVSMSERSEASGGGVAGAEDGQREEEAADASGVGNTYFRILQIPTLRALSDYYARYKRWRETQPVAKWLPSSVLEQLRAADQSSDGGAPATDAESALEVLANRHISETYAATARVAELRLPYESNIRRPYFHVEPLDMLELKNWHEYLDLELRIGTFESKKALFERCLVATCLYAEFWVRYAKFFEGASEHKGESREEERVDAAREVLLRAATRYCKRGLRVRTELALFEERQGNLDAARNACKGAMSLAPGMIEPVLGLAQLERRAGRLEEAAAVYETAAAAAEDDSPLASFLCQHYARFLHRIRNDVPHTRDVYTAALERCPSSLPLVLAAASFEEAVAEAAEVFEKVSLVYEAALSRDRLSAVNRRELLQVYHAFAADFAPRLGDVEELAKRHQRAAAAALPADASMSATQ